MRPDIQRSSLLVTHLTYQIGRHFVLYYAVDLTCLCLYGYAHSTGSGVHEFTERELRITLLHSPTFHRSLCRELDVSRFINRNLNNLIIYKYLRQYTTIIVLMQLYFLLGDMFRLIIQPSSGQFTIERYLTILRPILL